jgi:hypothetical protein
VGLFGQALLQATSPCNAQFSVDMDDIDPSGDCLPQIFVVGSRSAMQGKRQLLTTKVTAERWSDWLGFLGRYRLRRIDGDDVRLSTAAHNSARFPFISPPGSIRNHDQMIIDRIVDGGYFENYGALGAKELALAVHAVEPQLKPLVIVMSNDPADLLDPNDDATQDQHGAPRPVGRYALRGVAHPQELFTLDPDA